MAFAPSPINPVPPSLSSRRCLNYAAMCGGSARRPMLLAAACLNRVVLRGYTVPAGTNRGGNPRRSPVPAESRGWVCKVALLTAIAAAWVVPAAAQSPLPPLPFPPYPCRKVRPRNARPALPMCTGSARPLFRTPCGCWHVCNPIERGLARVATGSWSATVSDGGRSCPNFRSHGSALRIPVLPLLIWSASRQPVAPRRKAPYGDETDHVD